MRRPNNSNSDPEAPSGKAGVIDQDEQNFSTQNETQNKATTSPRGSQTFSAVDEARQMLDEIAGLSHGQHTPRPRRRDAGRTARAILLWPFVVIWAFLKLIFTQFKSADFRLLGEMRKFLSNPGHFFWFNRIAPEAASRHFGTTSTDAMTHHARRYGAHMAMLALAVIVVIFGGFSGLVNRFRDEYGFVPNASIASSNKVVIEDGREIYVNAVATDSKAFPRRIKTIDVKTGDSLRSIAAANNISLETVLYANNLIDPDSELKTGQRIVVPPVTGMLHIAYQGDTVGRVADIYGVDPKVILSYPFNNLEGADASTVLEPLREVMVPGGSLPLRDKVYMYTVRPNDTLKGVAEKFGIQVDTLLDNNDLDDGLKAGQQIRILPVDGVLYTVKKGETLNAIAGYLGTSPDNIINFKSNNVARNVPLQTGQSLVVPGGRWPPPPPPPPEVTPTPAPPKPAPAAPAVVNKAAPAVAPPAKQAQPAKTAAPAPAAKAAPAPAAKTAAPAAKPAAPAAKPAAAPAPAAAAPNAGRATGSMIWPMRGLITTYFGEPIWYGIHMGLDISTSCGTPVVAADGGTVVQSGWNGGYGNSVLIDHGGGIQTRYGHFVSQPPVSAGQRVAKGQLVGYEGTTGASTGCHLHFEVLVGGRYTDPLKWLK